VAAARRADEVQAVVSRGGRPDLAGDALADVQAPTLLIVGAADAEVLQLNRQALARLRCERRLDLGASGDTLVRGSGALETVSRLAGEWFETHLVTGA
jgi:putative phosphoribosyl transferase